MNRLESVLERRNKDRDPRVRRRLFSWRMFFIILLVVSVLSIGNVLMLEGLLYTLLSIIFSLLLSLILSPVLGGAVEQMFWFFSYRFTVWPVLLIAPVFVLLGLLIPLLTYRVIARHTIVERLRDGE